MPEGLWLVALIGLVQFTVEMLVLRNYALAVIFITTAALTLATGGLPVDDLGSYLLARGVDTAVGCAVALVVFQLTWPKASAALITDELVHTFSATETVAVHLANGDVALNITLTAINSLLCLVTLPVILNLSLEFFLGAGQYVPPPVGKVVEVAALIVLPVAIGMIVRAFAPGFAARMAKPIRILSVLVLALLIVAAVAGAWDTLLGWFAVVGLACLLFNLVSMGVGYAAPLALRLPRRQAIAIAMEIGIHNGTLAIFIALNVLGNATMSVPAAVYSLLMFFTAAGFAWWAARRHAPAPAAAARPS